MKGVVVFVGLSLLLSACVPAPLTALFASCPAPLTSTQDIDPFVTSDGRIVLEPTETEP